MATIQVDCFELEKACDKGIAMHQKAIDEEERQDADRKERLKEIKQEILEDHKEVLRYVDHSLASDLRYIRAYDKVINSGKHHKVEGSSWRNLWLGEVVEVDDYELAKEINKVYSTETFDTYLSPLVEKFPAYLEFYKWKVKVCVKGNEVIFKTSEDTEFKGVYESLQDRVLKKFLCPHKEFEPYYSYNTHLVYYSREEINSLQNLKSLAKGSNILLDDKEFSLISKWYGN